MTSSGKEATSAPKANLIAAGAFQNAGGSPANRVARWDGRDWHPIGDGFDAPVAALTVWRDQLVAYGRFDSSGATSIAGLAAWDGTS